MFPTEEVVSACKFRCVIHFTGIDAHPLHEVAEGQPGPAAVQVAVTGQGSAQCTDAASEQADGHDAAGAPRHHRTVELRAVPRGTLECGIAAHAKGPQLLHPQPSPNLRQAASSTRGSRRDSESEEEAAAPPAVVAAVAAAAVAAPTPPAAAPAAVPRVPSTRAQLLRPAACFGLLACVGLACVTAQVGAAAGRCSPLC